VEAISRRANIARQNTWWSIVVIHALASLALSQNAWAFDVKNAELIDKGFHVFTKETFNGNGRTCSTCHIPKDDYTISPADLPTLSAHDRNLVLATHNSQLENPTLVNQFGLFNITNDTPGASGGGTTPAGPFRASMQLSGLALTTLNDCPNATLIAAATDTGATAEITTTTLPTFPFALNEQIRIEGVSVAGYNGSTFEISSVINPTTFQYTTLTGAPITGLPSVGPGGGVSGLPTPPTTTTGSGVCSTAPNFATTPTTTGTRFIELGWAGDGAPLDPTLFEVGKPGDYADCVSAVNNADANQNVLSPVLSAFSAGAVRHHFARTNARVPGKDFRCPTSAELNALTAFQEYLGRQFPSGTPLELALQAGTTFPGTQVSSAQSVITFNDSTAETGKAIFLNPSAACNFCHFNAGASMSTTQVKTEPLGDPPLPFPGRNENNSQLVDILSDTTFIVPSTGATVTGGLDGATPVTLGPDPGDGNPFSNKHGGFIPVFNVQSIIEAPRKKSFFHNGAFNTAVEDAASFYFGNPTVQTSGTTLVTPGFDLANGNFAIGTNQDGSPVTLATGLTSPLPRSASGETGTQALVHLAGTYFPSDSVSGTVLTSPGGQDVLNTLGFFLRALNVVYSLADCERLVDDTVSRLDAGLSTQVPVLNCTTDLGDVDRVIAGARVTVPDNYVTVQMQAQSLPGELKKYASQHDRAKLIGVINRLQAMRHSIATISPDLSE
jgi:hypothetical protein